MELYFSDLFIIVVKAAIVLGIALIFASLITWVERKGSALIQNRVGANRAAIFGFDLAGIFNTLVADPLKALTKEDFIPRGTSAFLHALAPFLAVLPVLLSFAVIPFGPSYHWGNKIITLQLADLNLGVLYVFAMGSVAVYGVVLAGWVSNNKFSMLGSLRASAQMISYEVTMGLSIVGLLALYRTLNIGQIIEQQSGRTLGFLPNWGIFMLFPFNFIAFFIFFISMMAETKRGPFDLPESESELVAGYFTEFSGMKFLLFWLAEFAEIAVASSMIVVLFFGGWQLPYFDIATSLDFKFYEIGLLSFLPHWDWFPSVASLVGLIVILTKIALFSVLQIIIRWTLPRFRYDQLMNLCWKGMLPIALCNLLIGMAYLTYLSTNIYSQVQN